MKRGQAVQNWSFGPSQEEERKGEQELGRRQY
jgi:hypothetical protein